MSLSRKLIAGQQHGMGAMNSQHEVVRDALLWNESDTGESQHFDPIFDESIRANFRGAWDPLYS